MALIDSPLTYDFELDEKRRFVAPQLSRAETLCDGRNNSQPRVYWGLFKDP